MEGESLQVVTYTYEESNNDIESKNVRKSDTTFLLIIILSGAITSLFDGILIAWPSSVIPKLTSNNTEENPVGRPITTFEVSMLTGLPSLAMLLGSLIMGYLSEVIGRKRALQIVGIGFVVSMLPLAFSADIYSIITFRSLWSLFANGGFTVYSIYILEICEDHNKAKYGCLSTAFIPLGNLLNYALGSSLNIRNFTLAELTPIILFSAFFFFAPETPVYSLTKNKTNECIRALKSLRSNKNVSELETDLRKIQDTIKASRVNKKSAIPFGCLFNTKERRYGLLLAFFPVMMKIFCGLGIILPYMEPIFIAAETKFNSSHMPIIIASFKFFGHFLTSLIVEKCGRRVLLVASSVGSGVFLFILGLFFYLKSIHSPMIYQLQWLPLGCIICYIISISIGIGGIPQAIEGELFTPDIRVAGVTFISSFYAIFIFGSTATYPYIVEYVGLQWCFWIYSFFSLFGGIIMYIIIPENKGKSIDKIQEYIKMRCNK